MTYSGWCLPSNFIITHVVLHESWPLPTFSRSNSRNVRISNTVTASVKIMQLLLQKLIFVIEWHKYICCTLWPSLTFSRSTFLNVNISATMRAGVKIRAITFMEVDICHRITTNIVLGDVDTNCQGQISGMLVSRERES